MSLQSGHFGNVDFNMVERVILDRLLSIDYLLKIAIHINKYIYDMELYGIVHIKWNQ